MWLVITEQSDPGFESQEGKELLNEAPGLTTKNEYLEEGWKSVFKCESR